MAEGVGSDRGPGPIEGGQKEREKIIKNWGHISFFSLFPFSLSAACKIRLVTCSVIEEGDGSFFSIGERYTTHSLRHMCERQTNREPQWQ